MHLGIHAPPQYAISIYNATHNTWRRTRPREGIPMFCQCLSLPASGKLLLLGGCDTGTLEPVPHVYILDFNGAGVCRWRRGAPMSVPRSFFACAVVGSSTVYVAGGHDGQKNALRSAEVYDIEGDQWKILPDMIEARDECQGLAWGGHSRFWVVSGYGAYIQGQFRSDAEYYDPDTGCWSKVDGLWAFATTCPREATSAVSTCSNQCQWWLFLGGEQLQHWQKVVRVKVMKDVRWEIITSIPLRNCITGAIACMTSSGPVAQEELIYKIKHQVFMMSGGGTRSPPLTLAKEHSSWTHVAMMALESGTTSTRRWDFLEFHIQLLTS